jgi:hypothetical protein
MVGRPLRAKPSGPTGKTKRVVAPDDDPNFLKDLSEKLKREEDDNKDDKSK